MLRIMAGDNKMRSDYLLYLLAAVFFIITATSLALIMVDQTQQSLWVVTTVVLGLFSVGLGYSQRPKSTTAAHQPAPATLPVTVEPNEPQVKEAYLAENVERPTEPTPMPQSVSPVPMQVVAPIPVLTPQPVETPASMEIDLVQVKGIGEKRVAQLKALGIDSIDALANASAEDLAKNLTISPKITRMWIGSAKKLKK
jgi:predicted flap endonuclease-1-like 5' DNA nuclease